MPTKFGSHGMNADNIQTQDARNIQNTVQGKICLPGDQDE